MADRLLTVMPGIIAILLICSSVLIARRVQSRLNKKHPWGSKVWNFELDGGIKSLLTLKRVAYALLLLGFVRGAWRHAHPGSAAQRSLFVLMCAGYASVLWLAIRAIDRRLNRR